MLPDEIADKLFTGFQISHVHRGKIVILCDLA
jgi:hypothetical protein